MFSLRLTSLVLPTVAVLSIASCTRNDRTRASADTAFAAMQHRGTMAMGVDQYTSAHKFDLASDGGRIQLQRDSDDSLGVAQIRAHMKLIQHAFQAGDFSTPAFVHARDMPGTTVMSKKRALDDLRLARSTSGFHDSMG